MSDATTKRVSLIVQVYLREALEVIDSELGDGAARKNPELVAAYLSACGTIHAAPKMQTRRRPMHLER